MLEQLRRNSRSFIIWVLFGIIIAVFIISFGPQAQGEIGCGASDTYALEVDGHTIDGDAWRFGMNSLRAGRNQQERSAAVLDALIRREILAQAAADAGFRVSQELANERIAHGEIYLLTQPVDGKNVYFNDGAFDYEILDRWVGQLGLSNTGQFIEQQRRELLAQSMRGLLREGVTVSRDEALDRFVAENTTATVEAVVFRPARYRVALRLVDEDVERYLAEHEDAVKDKWNELEATYQDVGKQKRVREIFIAKKSQAQAGDAGAAEADPARDTIERARAQVAAGADFAEIARAQSEKERYAYLGGDLGWRSVDSPGLSHEALIDAVKNLEVGQMSEVLETPQGYHLIQISDAREGDLTYDQVKHELARDLALEHYSRELARRDAEQALAEAKAGTPLEEQFERGAPQRPSGPGQITPEMLQQFENMSEEERRELLQQMQGGQQGNLMLEEGPMVPAEWKGWDDQPAGDDAPGDEPTPAPETEAGAETEGGAETGAETEAETETGAGAAGAPEALAGARQETGSTELPEPVDLKPPELQSFGPFSRSPEIPGLGKNAGLVEAVFEELGEGQLADRVYEVGDDFVVLKVVSRSEADLEEFEDRVAELRNQYALQKSFEALDTWISERCRALAEQGKISINRELLRFDDDEGNPMPITYQPCSNL